MEGFEQARARWMAGGCLGAAALPFVAASGILLRTALVNLRQGDRPGALFMLCVGIAFSIFCFGFISFLFLMLRRGQQSARRMEMYASQPWLWRADWAERRVAETAPRTSAALWAFSVMWCAISLPLAFAVTRQPMMRKPAGAITLLFAAIGVVLLASAIYHTLQRHKFGRSICAIDRLPIEPGQTLNGTIEHRGAQVPDAGYRVALSCINRIVSHRGRDRTTLDEVLWDAEQRISGGVAAPTPDGMRVPFSFDIPAGAASTDLRTPDDTTLWQLDVSAELPGIDYKAKFELPVFTTAEKFAAHYAMRRAEAAERMLPPDSRVTETPLPSGGIELRVAPLRSRRSWSAFVFFAAIWFGTIGVMWKMGAPAFLAPVFSIFGLIALAIAVDFFIGTSTVSADRGGIRAQRKMFGLAKSTSLDATQIEAIEPKVAGHSGNHPYFDVEARLTNHSSRTLARYFERRGDAEAVAAKLWRALRG